MKNKMKTLIILLLSVLLLIGCSNNNEEPLIIDRSVGETPVTLEMWIMSNSSNQHQDLHEVLQPYLIENQHIEINIKVLSWTSAWSRIVQAVHSGEGPDILQLGTTWVSAFAAMEGLEDLSDLVPEIGGEDDYLSASWKTTMIEGKGNVYALPWFTDARAIYYRTDAFEKAGIDQDKAFLTWESFREALHQVNGVEIDGKLMNAMALPGKNDWDISHNIFTWIWSAGGDVLSEDHQKAVFNNDAALEGIMFYTGLVKDGLVDKTSLEKDSAQIEREFLEGDAAAIISGPWLTVELAATSASDDYAIAPIPEGPGGKATFIGGSNLSIVKGTEYKQQSWDVIKYLSSEDAQLAYSKFTGFLPARTSVLNSSEVNEDSALAAFAQVTPHGRTYPSIPRWGAIETTLVIHFSKVWELNDVSNKDRVKDILDEAVNEVNSILNHE